MTSNIYYCQVKNLNEAILTRTEFKTKSIYENAAEVLAGFDAN